MHRRDVLSIGAAVFIAMLSAPTTAEELDVRELTRTAISGFTAASDEAVAKLVARGKRDVIPSLILGLRYRSRDAAIKDALTTLTGSQIDSWHDAMLWQEAHPEVIPHESFQELKVDFLERIDAKFVRFLQGSRGRQENLSIRLEEITWGGVPVDGIPSLDNPNMITAVNADYLAPDDLVFGIAINGDKRAYPLRIMGWHEMFNDTIGGVPVALAYCTLCGAGILFETQVEGRDHPLVFGSSGLLYRSNKLMFDRETGSLWNQFTGQPVSGALRTSGIMLKIRPVVITTWQQWLKRHPDTKVLSLDTGYERDYGSGVVYREYFASPDLMFPTRVRETERVAQKDHVYGIRLPGAAKAWPIDAFDGGRIIHDRVGTQSVVLIGDAASRTVRAFERTPAQNFAKTDKDDALLGPDGIWKITEDALIDPNGNTARRIPGHISYWFAWNGYLGIRSELFQE